LYIVEFISHEKIEPLHQAFLERQELFESIRDFYSNNKKIVDIVNSILNIYNPQDTIVDKHKTNLLGENKAGKKTTINLMVFK
jgi:hypothetical protein